MKKKGLVFGMALSLVVCLCLALFCACGKANTNTGDTGSGNPSAQHEIYEKYVAYATAAGDDVLSYEEWLDSIRGKDGKDGLNGKDGQNGTNGQNGKDGLSAFETFKKYYPFYQGTEKDWVDDLIADNLELFSVTFKVIGEEDIVRYAFQGQAILDVPEVPEKIGNSGVWDTTDFNNITEDMTVNALYETVGLSYTLINNQQAYRVSAGTMSRDTEELFIPAVHDGKPVTVISEHAFGACDFKFAHLPESIVEIRTAAFHSCQTLQNIRIPSSVTIIPKQAFCACYGLLNIEMPQVTTIEEGAFQNCYNLATITMPQVIAIENDAFYDCHSSLTTIQIPNATTIGNSAFGGCQCLTTVEMPIVTTIGHQAFVGCSALEDLEIPDGVRELPMELFAGCTSLKYVILPSGITTIESDIFKGCTVFEAIYFKGNKEAWSALDKSKAGEVFNDAKVYYYADPMPEENEGDYWHYDVDNVTPVVWKKQS